MKHVRVLYNGIPTWGQPQGEWIQLEDGAMIEEADAHYLPPVEPTKIIATHLTYRSRVEEYHMKAPPATPSYFMKPLSSLSHHRAPVARPRGCRFLNYEGEIAVVIGRRCSSVSRSRAVQRRRALRRRAPPRSADGAEPGRRSRWLARRAASRVRRRSVRRCASGPRR